MNVSLRPHGLCDLRGRAVRRANGFEHTLVIDHNFNLALLHHTNTRVGSAQILKSALLAAGVCEGASIGVTGRVWCLRQRRLLVEGKYSQYQLQCRSCQCRRLSPDQPKPEERTRGTSRTPSPGQRPGCFLPASPWRGAVSEDRKEETLGKRRINGGIKREERQE